MNVFNLFIIKKRIVIIKAIRFSKNLKIFKIYFDLVNY